MKNDDAVLKHISEMRELIADSPKSYHDVNGYVFLIEKLKEGEYLVSLSSDFTIEGSKEDAIRIANELGVRLPRLS